MSEITHRNHFVPQFYMQQWTDEHGKLWSYRTLVAHENVPMWSHIPTRTVAARMDLYAEVVDGAELDEFEHWVKAEFEDPATEVLAKVRQGGSLEAKDWERLAMFFASQDVRTPTSLIESLQRWNREFPDLLNKTIRESVERLEEAKRHGVQIAAPPDSHPMARPFRVVIDREAEAPPGMVQIRAEVTPGRSLWLGSMRHLLTGVAETLMTYRWSLVEPSTGLEWLTSDHPTMRLNYNSAQDYSFGGGWGFSGTDLLMPLSPKHLLFTQVAKVHPRCFRFTPEQTRELQRLLCARAHREIFARTPEDYVPPFRLRVVDAAMVRYEEEEWARWHRQQGELERGMESDNRST